MSQQYVCDNPDCHTVAKYGLPEDWYAVTQESGPYRWHFCSAACLGQHLGLPRIQIDDRALHILLVALPLRGTGPGLQEDLIITRVALPQWTVYFGLRYLEALGATVGVFPFCTSATRLWWRTHE